MARDSIFLKEDGGLMIQSVMDLLDFMRVNLIQLLPAMLHVHEQLLRTGEREKVQLGMNAVNFTGMLEMDVEELKKAIQALPLI